LGIREDKVILIYNCVDTDRFTPERKDESGAAVRRELDVPEGAAVIGNVANFHRIKDHSTLLTAVAEIHNYVAEEGKPYLLLVGSGREERVIREKAGMLELLPHVRFAGSVADVERYYSAMDVFALTSLAEGFSNAVLEAMASGLPCVVTDVGGNAEAVDDRVNGYVVGPGDADAISEKVSVLLENGGLRADMGAAGRRIAIEKFGVDRMVDEIEEMYRGVLR
jgi:glycosyltransferase involved in cell wall biosynthesis